MSLILLFSSSMLAVDQALIHLYMSSVNYSKKAIKNHHGEVPVVVQKRRKKLNTYNTNSKTKYNNNNNNNKN